jgi:hypothetical protein
MLRTYAALSALGLLALVLLASLNGGGQLFAGFLPGSDYYGALMNSNTGQPVTLEMVQRDIEWHHDTARKLRELD